MKSDYSVIANYYDRYRAHTPATLRFWMKHIVALGQVRPGEPVLDLGCGTGRFAIPMSQSVGAAVYALDRAEAMVQQARNKEGSDTVGWTVGDAHALPFLPGSFACVFMSLVIHHVDDRPLALASIVQALRPGGRLVIWTSSHAQISRFFLGQFFPSLVPIDLGRFPPIETLMAEMRAAGFAGVCRQAVVKRETVQAADFLNRVRNRYISTLSLISDEELADGVEALARYLQSQGSDRLTRTYRYTFVIGQRPDL